MIVGYDDLDRSPLNIQLHDTYYVFSKSYAVFTISLLLIYMVYAVRQIFEKFRLIIPSFILLLTAILLIACTYMFFRTFLFLGISDTTGGWVIYPPLSALPQEYDTKMDDTVKIVFFVIQLIFVSTVLIVGWQLWKQLKR